MNREMFNQMNDAVRDIFVRENYDSHFATIENRVLVENRVFLARMEIWQRFNETETVAAIPLILFCPFCRRQHVDKGEWVQRLHSSHHCTSCNHTWRPADVPTVGVEEIHTSGDRDDVPIRVMSGRGATL